MSTMSQEAMSDQEDPKVPTVLSEKDLLCAMIDELSSYGVSCEIFSLFIREKNSKVVAIFEGCDSEQFNSNRESLGKLYGDYKWTTRWVDGWRGSPTIIHTKLLRKYKNIDVSPYSLVVEFRSESSKETAVWRLNFDKDVG